jgi:integrase
VEMTERQDTSLAAVALVHRQPGALSRQALSHVDSVVLPAMIDADTDAEAVACWLREYRGSPRTQQAYRREAERLLLWLADQGLSLTAMRREHLDTFEAFLSDPRPRARWVGPTRPRQDSRWRPFRGPLSPASRRQSLVILQGMFAWLVEAGWVRHNPFRLMRDKRRRLDNRQDRIERYLERPLWRWFWGWLNRPLEEGASRRQRFEYARRRFTFGFAYLLAPRIGEMSAARMADFTRREGRWWWQARAARRPAFRCLRICSPS